MDRLKLIEMIDKLDDSTFFAIYDYMTKATSSHKKIDKKRLFQIFLKHFKSAMILM